MKNHIKLCNQTDVTSRNIPSCIIAVIEHARLSSGWYCWLSFQVQWSSLFNITHHLLPEGEVRALHQQQTLQQLLSTQVSHSKKRFQMQNIWIDSSSSLLLQSSEHCNESGFLHLFLYFSYHNSIFLNEHQVFSKGPGGNLWFQKKSQCLKGPMSWPFPLNFPNSHWFLIQHLCKLRVFTEFHSLPLTARWSSHSSSPHPPCEHSVLWLVGTLWIALSSVEVLFPC